MQKFVEIFILMIQKRPLALSRTCQQSLTDLSYMSKVLLHSASCCKLRIASAY